MTSSLRVALSGWFWERLDTGSGQYVRRLLAALSRLEPAGEFFVLLPDDVVAQDSLAPNVHFVPVPSRKSGGGLTKVLWEQLAVPRAAHDLAADVLHIPYWAPPFSARIPTVVTVHDLIPLLLPAYRGGALVRLYTALVRATSARATLLLTDSEASRQDIVAHLRVLPARVWAVPLAADPLFAPQFIPQDADVLRNLNLQPGYVLYLGGFDVRKNLQTLFAAFARAYEALGEGRLVIAGKLPAADSDFRPDPRRLAREAGLPPESVCFLGMVSESDKPAVFRGAHLFLFPSIYEGFGLPPLEALSSGVPVVGSDASSLPEVVGDAGILTDPLDVAGMAGALINLLSDPDFYTDLKHKAQLQARRFSWDITAQRTLAAYREAVKS